MTFVRDLIGRFFADISEITLLENDREVIYEICTLKYISPDKFTDEHLTFLQDRDKFTFTITMGNGDPISFYSETPDNNFVTRLNEEYAHAQGEPINVEIKINKSKVYNTITIYDLDSFVKTVTKLSISEALSVFNRALSETEILVFEVLNIDQPFNTATIFFKPLGAISQPIATVSRFKLLESVRSVSYFTNFAQYQLVPNDFSIVNSSSSAYNNFCALLNYFSSVLSVTYIFDITTLNQNTLEYKLNGYKTIKGVIELKPLKELHGYFSIYQWTFNSGNLNDKLGLARNIISLHLYENELKLKGEPFQSIQSSYKVYEKQNIKQYIEIRNKISDQLLAFNDRATKVIETFASGFQKSALALISFYVSAFAIKALGKGEFKYIFTFEATILSAGLICGAYIYYWVARWEVKQQRKRFVDSYQNMKERYTDLLDENDISRILNNDREYNSDINFIDQKLKSYSRLWLALLLILFFTTVLLYSINSGNALQLRGILCSPTC